MLAQQGSLNTNNVISFKRARRSHVNSRLKSNPSINTDGVIGIGQYKRYGLLKGVSDLGKLVPVNGGKIVDTQYGLVELIGPGYTEHSRNAVVMYFSAKKRKLEYVYYGDTLDIREYTTHDSMSPVSITTYDVLERPGTLETSYRLGWLKDVYATYFGKGTKIKDNEADV